MRLLISGIIALSGLGVLVQMLGVHGATDEQAAIRRAVRAPFQDLRRRDARALCEDFTPAVAARLARGGGSCATRVGRLFRLSASDAEYVPARERARRASVRRISLHGSRATVLVVDPGARGQSRRWRLSLLHGRWRIATAGTLELRSDCAQHPFGTSGCLAALTLSVAGR